MKKENKWQRGGSAGKATCCQARRYEFNPKDPEDERWKDRTNAACCPLTPTHVSCTNAHIYAHTHTDYKYFAKDRLYSFI